MAVYGNRGAALSPGSSLALGSSVLCLRKLGLALGKGHAANVGTSTLLGLSLGVGLLVAFGGALLLVGMTNFETSAKKRSKAGQTEETLRNLESKRIPSR